MLRLCFHHFLLLTPTHQLAGVSHVPALHNKSPGTPIGWWLASVSLSGGGSDKIKQVINDINYPLHYCL